MKKKKILQKCSRLKIVGQSYRNAKMRYEEKIKGIKGLDPYEHSDRSGDVNLLPNYQHPYIYTTT